VQDGDRPLRACEHRLANVAEDEMCLLYGLYWPLERPVDASLDAARTGDAEHLLAIDQAGLERLADDPSRIQRTGLPVAGYKQVDDGGICDGCSKTGTQSYDEHLSDEENVFRF
jgi:hypothetical protein